MSIGASCDRCGGQFALFQLYNAEAAKEGLCPHCSVSLGLPGLSRVAAQADRALAALAANLRALTDERGRLRIHPTSVLDPLAEVLRTRVEVCDEDADSVPAGRLGQAASWR